MTFSAICHIHVVRMLRVRRPSVCLTFVIETFELLMKSCEKLDLLFMHIQCATACSLEKVNFKV